MKQKLIVVFFLFIKALMCQQYTYTNYLNDQKMQSTFFANLVQNNFVEAEKNLAKYKNTIGFYPHLMKAILLHHQKDTSCWKALAKAFRQGFNKNFLQVSYGFEKSDSVQINALFHQNYLKDFNPTLILQMDSLVKEDQRFRGLIEKDKCMSSHIHDSILALQSPIDIRNQRFLLAHIQQFGFPTALKVGDYFSGVTPVNPYLIFMHMGNTQRDIQIQVLKANYQLCLQQHESWGKLHALQFNLHHRFKTDWSEVSGLYIEKNKVDTEASFFSLHILAQITSQLPNAKLAIKCKNRKVANSFMKAFLVASNFVNEEIDDFMVELAKKMSLTVPKALSKNDIVTIIDSSVAENTIIYKIETP
jgi:hypothetical protein